MAQETFEEFLSSVGKSLGEYLKEGDFLLPVVHAEGDYYAPIQVGDAFNIKLTLEKIGTTSFALRCRFQECVTEKLLGSTLVVHVVIDRKSWSKVPIPRFLKDSFESLLLTEVTHRQGYLD